MPLDFTLAFGSGISQVAATALFKAKTVLQYSAPTTGSTVAITSPNTSLVIEPAGALLALTINMPGSPSDGDDVKLSCTQVITTVTMGGGTIVGTLTTIAASGFASYVYRAANTSWYRIG